jgi:serine/threonine protein kinase
MAVKSCNIIDIFHRDIKTKNILVNIEGNNNEIIAFLSDFGEAILLYQEVET